MEKTFNFVLFFFMIDGMDDLLGGGGETPCCRVLYDRNE
jgi:hypothetical protein